MSTVRLRTDPGDIGAPEPTILLDAFEGHDPASTVQVGNLPHRPRRDFVELPPAANDLLWLATAVLGADVTVSRSLVEDGWTREITLEVPLSEERWAPHREEVERMLNFLTGDRWSLRFLGGAPRRTSIVRPVGDVVCLLSGGLDSLSGAIDLLAGDDERRVLLVGARDSGTSASRQIDLGEALGEAFPDRVQQHRTSAIFRRETASQARPLPRERENTTRSRSFYFIAAGLARAALLGPEVPLFVPENGVIGINVPVSPSRAGSLSTRTTHPFFMSTLMRIARGVGITNPMENPYRLMTKGEALQQSRDPELLARLAPVSVSCAHPSALRYRGCAGPCGYCYPCLIRRASMNVIGADGPAGYCIDVLAQHSFVHDDTETNASLLAVVGQVRRGTKRSDVLRTGPIAPAEVAAFADVHRRGVDELEAWLQHATDPDLRALLA
jgi:hypothetical protein